MHDAAQKEEEMALRIEDVSSLPGREVVDQEGGQIGEIKEVYGIGEDEEPMPLLSGCPDPIELLPPPVDLAVPVDTIMNPCCVGGACSEPGHACPGDPDTICTAAVPTPLAGHPPNAQVVWLEGSLENPSWKEIEKFKPESCVHSAWIATPGIRRLRLNFLLRRSYSCVAPPS